MIDKFLESYGTAENFLRAYGGQVDFPEPELSQDGLLQIAFSRPIVFPTSLISEYDSDYIEVVPELKPTDEELQQIEQ